MLSFCGRRGAPRPRHAAAEMVPGAWCFWLAKRPRPKTGPPQICNCPRSLQQPGYIALPLANVFLDPRGQSCTALSFRNAARSAGLACHSGRLPHSAATSPASGLPPPPRGAKTKRQSRAGPRTKKKCKRQAGNTQPPQKKQPRLRNCTRAPGHRAGVQPRRPPPEASSPAMHPTTQPPGPYGAPRPHSRRRRPVAGQQGFSPEPGDQARAARPLGNNEPHTKRNVDRTRARPLS